MCFKICQTSASVLKFEILPWCEPIPQIKGNICKKIKWNATDLHVNVNDCCQICKLATKRAQRGINLAFTAATKWDLCIFLCDAKWCRYILQILKCVCLYSRKIDFHMQSQYLIPILRYKEKTFEIPRKNIWDTKKKCMRYKKKIWDTKKQTYKKQKKHMSYKKWDTKKHVR